MKKKARSVLIILKSELDFLMKINNIKYFEAVLKSHLDVITINANRDFHHKKRKT